VQPRFALSLALAATATLCAVAVPSLSFGAAAIPATPVMTVYRFNGPLEIPYYDAARFAQSGSTAPAGTLAQGSSVVPCLVVRDGRPLTDAGGTPYVGFELVVDARRATPASTARFEEVSKEREARKVESHVCPPGVSHVLDVRNLYAMDKPPRFDPPRPAQLAANASLAGSEVDAIVRDFHASPQCEASNERLIGRRAALQRAWDAYAAASRGRWPAGSLARARQLDYVMRTALYEGHLDRGCSAYGACERNVIALSIRNRGRSCSRGQGCRSTGDYEGVASSVSQYNIWDELLTQTSGLTGCFLRPDLASHERYAKLQRMYAQNAGDVERILFGDEAALATVFPGESPSGLGRLRHYYHPPAMGKCFPDQPRLEYISGAVARRGDQLALIANERIHVDAPQGSGYLFREATVRDEATNDVVEITDTYPGFVIDGRKIALARPSMCSPYGTPRGCRFPTVGRHRKTPSWLSAGEPFEATCRVRASGETCAGEGVPETVAVGGVCDVAMQPIAGVP